MHFGTVLLALAGKTFIQNHRGMFHYTLTTFVCVLPGICWQIHNFKKLLFYLARKTNYFPDITQTVCGGNITRRVPSSIRNYKSISSSDYITQTDCQMCLGIHKSRAHQSTMNYLRVVRVGARATSPSKCETAPHSKSKQRAGKLYMSSRKPLCATNLLKN